MYNSVNIVYGIVMLIGRRAIGEAASRRQTEKAATLCGRLLRSTTAGSFAYSAPSGMMITASSTAECHVGLQELQLPRAAVKA